MATDVMLSQELKQSLAALDYEPCRTDVAICLTTVPARLWQLRAVLPRLLAQSICGVPIELHLARSVLSAAGRWTLLPEWLRQLHAVRIVWHEADPGPALKYLGPLQRHEHSHETVLVVVDDDVLYPHDLAETLLTALRQQPRPVAVCARGWRLDRNLSWSNSPFVDPAGGSELRRVAVITGHGGYAVPVRGMRRRALVALDQAPPECRLMDDVWLSGHLSKLGVPKYTVRTSPRHRLAVHSVIGADRERRNRVVFEHFRDDWQAEEWA